MIRLLTGILLLGSTAPALAKPTLSEIMVTRFSSRWKVIQNELSDIDQKQKPLPNIPLGDLGGTGGLISYTGDEDGELNVLIRWSKPAEIDLVALVPARRFNSEGLDPEFGLPHFFEIELLDENDNPIHLVARENAADRPIKKGFPFLYSLPEPVSLIPKTP